MGALVAVLAAATQAHADGSPSMAVRSRVSRSLVYVEAYDCADLVSRAGTGFVYRNTSSVITDHHVVGGCRSIKLTYPGAEAGSKNTSEATIARVFVKGDLALLKVSNAVDVPPIAAMNATPDPDGYYSGLGFQNGQTSSSDITVTFSSGSDHLRDIIPYDAREQLVMNGSQIDFSRDVLRFKDALQPGMSGGPIIDDLGRLIGIVAGGLKAGAAPASWGWPASWISDLLSSSDSVQSEVRVDGVYYSSHDLDTVRRSVETGRVIHCGAYTFRYHGTRSFGSLAQGADNQSAIGRLKAELRMPDTALHELQFDTWAEEVSGATVVTPAGYDVSTQGNICVVQSPNKRFTQVIWSSPAADPAQIQQTSLAFENLAMFPLAPYQFGFANDPTLSTNGTQFRDGGLVFVRKAFFQPRVNPNLGMPVPWVHTFETLAAKSGTFIGVGTLNNDVSSGLSACILNGYAGAVCPPATAVMEEWSHFLFATQFSTYPST